jgi:hypothetical protein
MYLGDLLGISDTTPTNPHPTIITPLPRAGVAWRIPP